jgi:hypothetical protein
MRPLSRAFSTTETTTKTGLGGSEVKGGDGEFGWSDSTAFDTAIALPWSPSEPRVLA